MSGIIKKISSNMKGENMNSLSRMVLVSLFAVSMITACVISPRGDVGLLLPPPLPFIVDIGPDRYYQHEGYHYYYEGDRWLYSRDRGGARVELPRSYYPREIRHRGDWR
jgi:hypothetical protein